jgi:hypothetical protein
MEEVKPVFAENPRPLKRPVVIDLTGGEGFTKEELELEAAKDLEVYGLDEQVAAVDLPSLYVAFFFPERATFVFRYPRCFAAPLSRRCPRSTVVRQERRTASVGAIFGPFFVFGPH